MVMQMESHTDLSEVVHAEHARGRFPHFLHGWKDQSHQQDDDADDHEQFNQCHAMASFAVRLGSANHVAPH
jgi:hypothetical protein